MKKLHISVLVMVTLLFAGFLIGFSAGRYSRMDNVIISVRENMLTQPTATEAPILETAIATEAVVFPIDINLADKEDFMKLPGIGEVLAIRILTYREKNGSFSHVTELMNVEGIGQTRMEAILDYVTTGG